MNRSGKTLLKRITKVPAVWVVLGFLVFLWLNNTSLLADRGRREATLVAHAGLGQTYDLQEVQWNTNTAAMINVPEHPFIENTLPSMQAAFDCGADMVEFDIRLTKDRQLAVFHDHTLEFRTDGKGLVSDHTMEELRRLDVGYGYTADNGRSFPLRGKGIGLMVSIDEVFRAYPKRMFLVHIKDPGLEIGQVLLSFLETLDESTISGISAYGNDSALELLRACYPNMKILSKSRMLRALLTYELIGWSGYMPKAIRNMELHLPAQYAWFLWGWPHRFLRRMDKANTRVVLVQYVNGWSAGFDSESDLRRLPRNYTGAIWTNRIDIIGPLLK